MRRKMAYGSSSLSPVSSLSSSSTALSTTTLACIHTIINYITYSLWTLCNKYQFTKVEWHVGFPLAATSVQMTVAGLVAYVCVKFLRYSEIGPLPRQVFWRRIVPLGLVRSTDIGFGNLSLTLVTVAFQQIIKSTIPIYVCVLSVVMLRRRIPPVVWLSLTPIVFGTVLASTGKIGANTLGAVFALISCGGRAFKAILNSLMLNTSEGSAAEVKLDTYTILMYEAPLSGLVLGVVALLVEWRALYHFLFETHGDAFLMPVMFNIMCGVLMFFNQLSYLSIIQHTSALTCQVLMNLKMVILILVSVAVFNTPIGGVNYLGIAIAAGGCMLYAKLTSSTSASSSATASGGGASADAATKV